MRNMKKIMAVMAVASLVATSGMTAFAYEYEGNQGTTTTGGAELSDNAKEYGHTTFSIIESEEDPTNVSFTVPLFVTMAAVDGSKELIVPTNYDLKNTSETFDIAVVSMEFTSLESATYSTIGESDSFDGDDSVARKQIKFALAGLYMPAILASSVETTELVDIIGQSSEFYKEFNAGDGEEFRLIPTGDTFNMPITAQLGADAEISGNSIAVPQFKVQYVVSGVTSAGEIIGTVYAGDDIVAAGLSAYTAVEPTN